MSLIVYFIYSVFNSLLFGLYFTSVKIVLSKVLSIRKKYLYLFLFRLSYLDVVATTGLSFRVCQYFEKRNLDNRSRLVLFLVYLQNRPKAIHSISSLCTKWRSCLSHQGATNIFSRFLTDSFLQEALL